MVVPPPFAVKLPPPLIEPVMVWVPCATVLLATTFPVATVLTVFTKVPFCPIRMSRVPPAFTKTRFGPRAEFAFVPSPTCSVPPLIEVNPT